MFQRRHYDWLATWARQMTDTATPGEIDSVIKHAVIVDLADALAEDNPNFDRGRFLLACGMTGTEEDEE